MICPPSLISSLSSILVQLITPHPSLQAPWPHFCPFQSILSSSLGPRVICLKQKTDHLSPHFKMALVPQNPPFLAWHSRPSQPSWSHLPLPAPASEGCHVLPVTRARPLCGPSARLISLATHPPTPRAWPRTKQVPEMLAEEQNPENVATICAIAMASPESHQVWAFWKHHFE